jgi:predicted nucleotidyltransferase
MIDPELLDTIIRRIVEVAQPEKIILFGSAARGEMGPNSDLDLLVIKSCARRRKLAMEIYRHVGGLGCALDIIVVTPEDVQRYGQSPALIIEPALREGKVVYAA